MRHSRSHSILTLALVTALLARSLIAPGYMPDGDSGGTVRLCHSGISAAVAAVLFNGHAHAHAAHAHGERNDVLTSDQLCPLGEGPAAAQLPAIPQLAIVPPTPAGPFEPATVGVKASPARGFEARAPPVAMV